MKEMTASEMGRKRWKGVGKQERAEIGRSAAAARHASLTPEERSAIAKKAAHARWHQKKGAGK